MDTPTERRAREVLANAETQLQKLVGDAVETRDYQAAAVISIWAGEVSKILRPSVSSGEGQRDDPEVEEATANSDAASEEDLETQINKPIGRAKRPIPKSVSYPHFLREGSQLVKVGRAGAGKTYEHKADRDIVDVVARCIVTAAAKRKRFQVSDIERAQRANGNVSMPNYQLYVAVAWLKWAGLIVQHGRQGYSLPAQPRFLDDLNAAWEQLPLR